ncbi:hypothetical protein BON30_47270 [Cystobacter ferrugineus]|uniref:C2 domain-containing protein n=2 Tax=Cystobacter ferrugineus TaxID=83449 RepID=A0A1L9AUP3_9BACT|nr:hypothetical protein BON30_47270 [Cystobacter ferrugineus]
MGAECSMCQLLQSCQKEDVLRGWECLTDRATQWSLQPLSASVPPSKPDGGSWDMGSDAPDVVVELDCPVEGTVGKVKTAESPSFTPSWQDGACVTTAPEWRNAPIHIKVLDVDFLSSEEILTTSYTLEEEDFAAGTIELPISADGAHTLKLKLSRVQ